MNINFKIDITWHDIAVRAALVLCTVAAIVWFMPRDSRNIFKLDSDMVWRYHDLTTTFDFPVIKSDTTLLREQAEALKNYEPYYIYHETTGPEQELRFAQQMAKTHPELTKSVVNAVRNKMRQLYHNGIIDTSDPLDEMLDSMPTIKRIDGKVVESVDARTVATTVQAYESIIGDTVLQKITSQLQQLNLNDYLVPNLTYDRERSEQSRQELISSVPKSMEVVKSGQKIVSQGELVDEHKQLVIKSYLKKIDERQQKQSGLTSTITGELLYVLILVAAFTIYLSLYRKDYFERVRSVVMLFVLLLIFTVLASLLVSHSMMHIYILPFAIVPIFIRVFMDSRTAFMAHTTVVLICACILQRPLEFIAVEMAAGMAAIYSLRELSSRSQLFWTAIVTTGVAIVTNLAIYLIRSGDVSKIDNNEYVYLIICGIIIFCSYPLLYLIEKTFGFISGITLIELSDMNKDLLRRMSEVAPGTFQHSIQVGNLAAEMARKIDANPQLVRTGALYHDIGKMQNPIYFTENQSGGINPHNQLSYIDSAQMIVSHVTEGLKLADKYNLPMQIRDLIATHHGQGKAKYFYIKYKNEHPDEPVDDLLFTYPGPNPFTKEQAVLMMADAVEAASRSLPDYTEQTIRDLVNRIIDGQVQEGFFRECPITFRDIQYAKTVLIEKLKTIYHTRITYPEENKNS